MRDPDYDSNSLPTIDLHRLSGAQAERRLAQEFHACRVRGVARVVIVTGRGYGNAAQQPILRTHIEGWLAGAQAKSLGVLSFRRVHREGALEVVLATLGHIQRDDEDFDPEEE
jgi:DNA-nicking Smr family endonuclease